MALEGAETVGEALAEDDDAEEVLGLALGWPVELLPHAERTRTLANSAEARAAGRRRRVIVPTIHFSHNSVKW